MSSIRAAVPVLWQRCREIQTRSAPASIAESSFELVCVARAVRHGYQRPSGRRASAAIQARSVVAAEPSPGSTPRGAAGLRAGPRPPAPVVPIVAHDDQRAVGDLVGAVHPLTVKRRYGSPRQRHSGGYCTQQDIANVARDLERCTVGQGIPLGVVLDMGWLDEHVPSLPGDAGDLLRPSAE